jgi:hypothetical protein
MLTGLADGLGLRDALHWKGSRIKDEWFKPLAFSLSTVRPKVWVLRSI